MTQPEPEFDEAIWNAIIQNAQPEIATPEDIETIKGLAITALGQTPTFIEADHGVVTVHGTLELKARCLNNKQFSGVEVLAALTKHVEPDYDSDEDQELPEPDLTITVGTAALTFKPPLDQIPAEDIAEYKLILLEAYMGTPDANAQLFYGHLSRLLDNRNKQFQAPILDGEFVETKTGMVPAVDMGCRTVLGANDFVRSVQKHVALTSPISQLDITKKDLQKHTPDGLQHDSLDVIQLEILQSTKRVVKLEIHDDGEIYATSDQPHEEAELLKEAEREVDEEEYLRKLGYNVLKTEYAQQILAGLNTVVAAQSTSDQT